MADPRYFVSPAPNELLWVFGKGAFGPARWLIQVRGWEVDGAGRMHPITQLELQSIYDSNGPGYRYALPIGEHWLYQDKIYDSVDACFSVWLLEVSK